MTLNHQIVAALSVAAVAITADAARAQTAPRDPPPLPPGAIAEWTARHHPSVFTGDPHINAMTFVVDTNSQYVASSADSLPLAVTAAIDSTFAWIAAHNAIQDVAVQLVEGRLRVPGGDSTPPVYIVDGVRTKRVDSVDVNAIESIQLVKPADAVPTYGPEAAKGGAVVVTTVQHGGEQNPAVGVSIRQRLEKLGIPAGRVDLGNMMWIFTRAGGLGPKPIYINVLHLKGGTP